ncbi:MAG: hypothetical protein J5680_06405 [Neisseriaceae bacterium]|nr:hypothetical protein [Neisseriaceae bacterium]
MENQQHTLQNVVFKLREVLAVTQLLKTSNVALLDDPESTHKFALCSQEENLLALIDDIDSIDTKYKLQPREVAR